MLAGTIPVFAAAMFVLLTMAVRGSDGQAGPSVIELDQPFTRADLARRMADSKQVHYTVDARVRPLLLFWIGRSDIGTAEVSWRRGPSTKRALELLIGSDPERAPRRINRWGFIAEEVDGPNADVIGLMRESGEQSLDEADKATARVADTAAFKAVRTHVRGREARTVVETIWADAALTHRDVDALLRQLGNREGRSNFETLAAGVRPGFLVALDDLLRESAYPCGQSARLERPARAAYFYRRTVYDLELVTCERVAQWRHGSASFADLIDGRFLVRNRTTRTETAFRVVYHASGLEAGVPVRVVFRPQWWIEIELVRAAAGRPSVSGVVGEDGA
jgi:hypothetical protein